MIEWYVFLSVSLSVLLVLFLSGPPLFVSFLLVNLGTVLMLLGERGLILVANSIFDSANIASLSAIPLFILMGEILTRSGSVENLFRAMDGLIGRVPGRQYVLTVAISVIFGALSGAAMAVAAMLGRSLYPTMIDRGYDRGLSIGTILAGASLAPIIPPSVLIVVIATLADVSVGRLLIAGVGPGLVAAVLILLYIALRVARREKPAPEVPDTARRGWREIVRSIGLLLPFSIIIFAVMGLILLGVATPSEAAASGVLGSALVAAIYGRFSLQMIRESVSSAMLITAMIMVIVASSNLFGQMLGLTGATRGLIDWGGALAEEPYVLLTLLLVIVFVLCMFIDQIALMLILVPIYKPLVEAAGFDPIWFWLLVLLNLSVGGITPPFGYTMFAFKATAPEIGLGPIYRAAWPFVGVFIVLMAVVVAVPGIATWLPAAMN